VSAPEVLTSPKNPRVLSAAKLRESRERRRTGRMLIEGTRELERALAAGVTLEEVFRLEGWEPGAWAARLEGVPQAVLGPRAFEKLAYRRRPEPPLIAVAATPGVGLETFEPRGEGPLLVVEGLEKPGNLGAVLRLKVDEAQERSAGQTWEGAPRRGASWEGPPFEASAEMTASLEALGMAPQRALETAAQPRRRGDHRQALRRDQTNATAPSSQPQRTPAPRARPATGGGCGRWDQPLHPAHGAAPPPKAALWSCMTQKESHGWPGT